jgi:hypothetical protein
MLAGVWISRLWAASFAEIVPVSWPLAMLCAGAMLASAGCAVLCPVLVMPRQNIAQLLRFDS